MTSEASFQKQGMLWKNEGPQSVTTEEKKLIQRV